MIIVITLFAYLPIFFLFMMYKKHSSQTLKYYEIYQSWGKSVESAKLRIALWLYQLREKKICFKFLLEEELTATKYSFSYSYK